MTGEKYTFETARIRLEEIVAEVRKKDTSLEKSLDLLEEGVRLANVCTEFVDHTEVVPVTAAADTKAENTFGNSGGETDLIQKSDPEHDGVDAASVVDGDAGADKDTSCTVVEYCPAGDGAGIRSDHTGDAVSEIAGADETDAPKEG